MPTSAPPSSGLRRGLSVWPAIAISVALMTPSMAANINPQGTASQVGRATPLAFFLAALAVLLIAYVFVRLCQYYRHAGSVYVFAGATLGPHAGAIAGLGLVGTYTFYGLVTSSAAGIFGASFLGIIFGLLSFAGFEAAATLGEEADHPRRDIPRAILGTAIFGGIFFTLVTAVEMTAFGTDAPGVKSFRGSSALMGDLGSTYVGDWVGDVITLGAAVSAFACCLACVVGASRMVFAVSRDLSPGHPLSRTNRHGAPAAAATLVASVIAIIALVCAVAFAAKPFDTFFWSGTIGTLILLVAYLLATVGCIKLVFVERRLAVPQWQVVIPVAAVLVILYTLYRNVWPYPDSGAGQWLPVVAFGWLLVVTAVVVVVPSVPRRLAVGMAGLTGDDERERV